MVGTAVSGLRFTLLQLSLDADCNSILYGLLLHCTAQCGCCFPRITLQPSHSPYSLLSVLTSASTCLLLAEPQAATQLLVWT